MKFKLYIFVFCCFILLLPKKGFSYENKSLKEAQQTKIDNISKRLEKLHSKKDSADVFIERARLYSTVKDFDKAIEDSRKGIRMSEEIDYQEGVASAYASLGSVYFDQGDFSRAKKWLLQAEYLLKQNNQEIDLTFIYRFLGEAHLKLQDTLAAIEVHKKGLELSKKLGIQNRIAYQNDFLGYIYFYLYDYSTAIDYFEQSLHVFQTLKINHRTALSAGNIGLSYFNISRKRDAIHYFMIAAKHYKKGENIPGLIWTNSMISEIYQEIGDFYSALNYIDENIALYEADDDEVGILSATINHLELEYLQEKNAQTIQELLSLEKSLEKLNNNQLFLNYFMTLASLYFQEGNQDYALENLAKSKPYIDRTRRKFLESKFYFLKGEVLMEKQEFKAAAIQMEEALLFSNQSKRKTLLPRIYEMLSILSEKEGDFKKAFMYHRNYMRYANVENQDNFAAERLAYQFEYEKKEAVTKAELKTRKLQRNVAIGGFIIVLIFVVILSYLFRLRKKNLLIKEENIEMQKRKMERIKKVEQFKSRFLINIAHEFKTPLTLIKGNVELLGAKETEDINSQRWLDKIEKNSDYLLMLIHQLMDLSKMKSHEYKLQFQQGNLMQVINRTAANFESQIAQKELHFSVKNQFKENFKMEEFVFSNEVITTVLTNLLSNAIKNTPRQGIIQLEVQNNENQFIVLQVRDTGVGISKESLSHVFERFFQADSTLEKESRGTGIGLSFVKELSMLHGGNVEVQSEVGKGSTFTVRLQNQKHEEHTVVQAKALENRENSVLKQKNSLISTEEKPLVLVVEDREEIRTFLVENLTASYQIMEAKDGKEGVQLAQEYIPDLIISDVMMPKMNGFELCEIIKSTTVTAHIPVVLLTGKSSFESRIKGLKFGADDYLAKPFSIEEVKLRVRNMLNSRALLRKLLSSTSNEVREDALHSLNKIDKKFMNRMEEVILNHLDDSQFNVALLSEKMFLSSSQLTRKMKALIGKTPAHYIKEMRMKRAKTLLKEGYSVSETAWKIGFTDPVYFSKAFKKYTGKPPSEFITN